MQYPRGAEFNPNTMRMELSSFSELFFNSVAQVKLMHTLGAGYVTGAIFVLAISSLYLLRGKFIEIARKSIVIATSLGVVAITMNIFAGDEAGHEYAELQPMKIAAIEAHWNTGKIPADFSVISLPNMKTKENDYEIKIPALMGVLVTRSLDKPVIGINQIVENAKVRIRNGIKQFEVLKDFRNENSKNREADAIYLKNNYEDIGHALLLKSIGLEDITKATESDIDKAAEKLIPNVPVIYWSFRIMVGTGLLIFIIIFTNFYYNNIKNQNPKWLLRVNILSLPFPWICAELGWIVAEYGRQPWSITGILPTSVGASALTLEQITTSLGGYFIFYSIFLVVDLYYMVKYIKQGPYEK